MGALSLFWRKIKIKVVSAVVNTFAYETNSEVENTFLVVGSTRSGTTFLMESLNQNNEFRLIFEPFNGTYTKLWSSFGPRHYINPEHPSQLEIQSVDQILRGMINNKWINRYNRKIKSNKRLIKAVRANLLLDYFENSYPQMRIIFVLRNPYDVVSSRIKLNFDPKDVFSIFDHLTFFNKYYSDLDPDALRTQLDTPIKCHTALWCLENRFVMETKDQRKIDFLRYEDIKDQSIRLDNDRMIFTEEKRKPSLTSFPQSSYTLSPSERKEVDEILVLFGLSKISS